MKNPVPLANIAFNHTAKTVTFTNTVPTDITRILSVFNTTRKVFIFLPIKGTGYSGTYSSPTLTLEYDTTGFADADILDIVWEDGTAGLTDIQLRATAVPISGTVTANTGLTQPVTDTQLRASAVPISGTVTANTGLTQPLTDTQLRATAVPVSIASLPSTAVTGPLTDTQLRATPVPVSGTVSTGALTDTQLRATAVPVSGTVSTGLSQPLTDTQLRATAVPVSGPVTDTQLRASAIPVSVASVPTHGVTGTFWPTIQPVSIDQTTPGTTNNVIAGGVTVTTSASPTVTAASAYASGNCVGGLLTFANAARVSSGLINKVVITSKSAQTAQMDLILFDANPTGTTVTDKAAVAVAVADFAKVIGSVNVLNWTNTGTTSNGTAPGVTLPFAIPSGTSLYGILVVRGTPTFTATSDITVTLGIHQD